MATQEENDRCRDSDSQRLDQTMPPQHFLQKKKINKKELKYCLLVTFCVFIS